ncbi:MAG TPA: hypothetical protein VNT76_02455 [Candidatus Binatus sp.]|nr:hypothetical protein [Candidatus Binatus sp.]
MNPQRRLFLQFSLFAATNFLPGGLAFGADSRRSERFSAEERRIIEEYYHQGAKSKKKGLPPGLAKRGGNLPPGLQKKLDRDGQLPPGLQKRMEPLPVDLNRRLPRLPDTWERMVLEHDVILIDRRTNRILDIIEDVIGLATGR